MVSFSCDSCAEILKKNQVDAHVRKCRSCTSVSCVDCSISFHGDDYRHHTSCISEAERYEKSVYRGPKKNETGHRKLSPQEAWMETIRSSLDNPIPSNIQGFIQQLSNMENVPRKENAFINFAINSLRLRGDSGKQMALAIWNHLSQVRAKQIKSKIETTVLHSVQQIEDVSTSISPQLVNTQKQDKDKSLVPSAPQSSSFISQTAIPGGNQTLKQTVEKIMTKVLKKQSPEHRLPFKLLRKKIKTKLRIKKIELNKGDLKKSIIQSHIVMKEGKDILLL